MNPMIAVWLLFAALLLTLIFVIVFVVDVGFKLNLNDSIYVIIMGLIFIIMLTALLSIIFFNGVGVVK